MSADLNHHLIEQASILIERRTGLARSAQFQVNLPGVLTDLAGGDLARLVQTLRQTPETAPIWQRLVNSLLIGETYFFRNRLHFQALRERILPDVLARRRDLSSRLHIWSAGCATGEEPYSVAITLREHIPNLKQWTVRLIGSDINAYAISAAQQGIYRNWAFRHTNDAFKRDYFTPQTNGLQIKPEIQAMATFQHSNLLGGPPLPGLDIILCCNVLIYFEENAIRQVEDMLYEALTPGGWLLLGQAELIRFRRERWQTHIFQGAIMYQKPLATTTLPAQSRLPSAGVVQTRGYAQAVEAMRAKRYEEAERILAEVLLRDANHAQAYTLLGGLLANRRAAPEAIRHLEMALKINPLQADAHYLKGVLFLENSQADAAHAALRAALYCQRGHPLAGLVLGQLYLGEGDHRRARRVWEEVRHNLAGQRSEALVSDFSDLTTAGLDTYLKEQLSQMVDRDE